MRKKALNIFTIITLVLSTASSFSFIYSEWSEMYIYDISRVYLLIIGFLHIILLFMYIFSLVKKDKFNDKTKFEKTLIFTNFSLIVIFIIDLFYNKYLDSLNYFEPMIHFPFLQLALFIYELIYVLFIIWLLILLRKTKKEN